MVTKFEEKFSDLAKSMKASEIRELLKLTEDPEIISFAGGLPNPKALPIGEIVEIISSFSVEEGETLFQYGPTEGYKKLRQVLAEMMSYGQRSFNYGNVLITTGSQQGLYLVGKVFLNPGDSYVCEAPTYLAALQAFKAFEANAISIPIDDNGMRIDILEEKLSVMGEKEKPKFIYTVPTFQNPAGVTMSPDRRKKLVELALEHGIPIVEDDPYGRLRFRGDPVLPILAFDKEGVVIYLGTFSKILAPGLRVGWVVGPEEVIRKLVIAKQAVDLCTPVFTQGIAYEFCRRGYLEKHVDRIRGLYKRKRDIMLQTMEDSFPVGVKWTKPDGGMFLWVTLPEHLDAGELLKEAIKEKVAYVIGSAFFADGSGKNTMRLNFSYPSDELVEEGTKRLARVLGRAIHS